MKKLSLILIIAILSGCSSYKDGKTPSDILNLYNEAALNFDFETIDRVTAGSEMKSQLKDALEFMCDNHKFFDALEAKFPDASDLELQDKFPVIFEVYLQTKLKQSKKFKEIDYKVEYQDDQAMIFEIATKQTHIFIKDGGLWKKSFSDGEIQFSREFFFPSTQTYKTYMKFISESKTFKEFKDHLVKKPVEDTSVGIEVKPE